MARLGVGPYRGGMRRLFGLIFLSAIGCSAESPSLTERTAAPLWDTPATAGRRLDHTATLLPGTPPRVLLIGGFERDTGGGDRALATVDEVTVRVDPTKGAVNLEPSTGTIANMKAPRYGHAAALLADGRIFVSGGFSVPAFLIPESSAEIYEPASNAWTTLKPMSVPRARHSATVLPDGRVLVVGGYDMVGVDEISPHASCEIFDPATGAWTKGPDMSESRFFHRAALVGSKVVVIGGTNVEVFDPAASAWKSRTAAPFSLTAALSVPIAADQFFVQSLMAEAATYDATKDTWSKLPPHPSNSLQLAAAALLDPTHVVVMGGATTFGTSSTAHPVRWTFVLDLVAKAWYEAEPMEDARFRLTATQILDGAVLVAGGGYDGGLLVFRRHEQGEYCVGAGDCLSHACADGVCCDRACEGIGHECERCDTATDLGKCVAVEGPFNHCPAGNVCASKKCTPIAGATCASDRLSSVATNGTLLPCDNFLCDPATGACATTCTNSDMCVPGAACDPATRLCVPSPSAAVDGGCAAQGRAAPSSVGALLGFVALSRWRRRRV